MPVTGSTENAPSFEPNFNIQNFLDLDNMTEAEIDRCEFWVTANRLIRETGCPNFKESRIPVNHSWNFEFLQEQLKDYEDKEVLEFFKFGWPLNAVDTAIQVDIPTIRQAHNRISIRLNSTWVMRLKQAQ